MLPDESKSVRQYNFLGLSPLGNYYQKADGKKLSCLSSLWLRATYSSSYQKPNYVRFMDRAYPVLQSKFRKIIETKAQNETTKGDNYNWSWSIYKRIKNFFTLPVVYADGPEDSQSSCPSATDIMEARMGKKAALEFSETTGKEEALEIELESEENPYEYVTKSAVDEILAKETGMDRLKEMYSLNHRSDGFFSDELTYCLLLSAVTYLFTTQTYYMIHKRKLDEENEKIKKTKLYEKNISNLRKKAFRTSLNESGRLGTAIAICMFVSQSIAVYRNKTSVWEYVVGMGIGSAIFRLPNCPTRIISILNGSLFGLGWGVLIFFVCNYANETQEERHRKMIEDYLLGKEGR